MYWLSGEKGPTDYQGKGDQVVTRAKRTNWLRAKWTKWLSGQKWTNCLSGQKRPIGYQGKRDQLAIREKRAKFNPEI